MASSPQRGQTPDSFRPALVKLARDTEDLEADLLAGFSSRREILMWMQRVSIRTLGELPQAWFYKMAEQFRGVPNDGRERVLLSALLRREYRTRELAQYTVDDLRERLAALTIRPAFHRAFRSLRKDAGEYIGGDDEDATHSPGKQRFVAMRPAIDELEGYQQSALEELLDGFEDRSSVLRWGTTAELATHGELPEAFVARCYREESTIAVLTGDRAHHARARELFAAHHLVPYFNRGIRDLAGRTGEQPDAERTKEAVQLA